MTAKSQLKKARTIAEIYAVAKELKKQGMPATEVNVLVNERKAELLRNSDKVKYLKKVRPNPLPLQGQKVTQFRLDANALTSGHIIIDDSGLITL